jgi:hypothetical protein
VLAAKAQTENRGNSWQLSDAQLDDQRPRKNALLSPGARPERCVSPTPQLKRE